MPCHLVMGPKPDVSLSLGTHQFCPVVEEYEGGGRWRDGKGGHREAELLAGNAVHSWALPPGHIQSRARYRFVCMDF